MSLTSDLRMLYRLAFTPIRGLTHQERLESFYRDQAHGYDAFRERLLHGRKQLFESLIVPQSGHWIDFGGGTGRNLEFWSDRIHEIAKVTIVDLSPSLLAEAQLRKSRNNWGNVSLVQADATKVSLEQADLVTFSYSLTMIPEWYLAIDHAVSLLRPGGTIGVVDFYVSRKYVEPSCRRHGWITRHLWPAWFATDNVYLNADHLPYLRSRTREVTLIESQGSVPFLPWLKVPNYQFIGVKNT